MRALSPGLIDVADSAMPEANDGNLGFLRNDANLSVVFVSNTVDQSPDTLLQYFYELIAIKGFRNANMFSAHAIVGDFGGCTVPGGGSAADGHQYRWMASQSGGSFASVCSSSWSEVLESIGAKTIGFRTRFALGGVPEDSDADGAITDRVSPPEIEVFVNGTRMPSVSSRGEDVWAYDATTNEVVFERNFVPAPGSQIEVTYKSACLEPR